MKASMLYISFRNLENIHEIKEGPKNNSHLLPHVNTKLFHLSAHIHVFNNINFAYTTPIYPWKVAHITWLLKQEYLTISNTHDVS